LIHQLIKKGNISIIISNLELLAIKTEIKIEKIKDSIKIVLIRQYVNFNLTHFMRKFEIEIGKNEIKVFIYYCLSFLKIKMNIQETFINITIMEYPIIKKHLK
jgi:hypothetical protein